MEFAIFKLVFLVHFLVMLQS